MEAEIKRFPVLPFAERRSDLELEVGAPENRGTKR